jgi:hypothetical protein
MYCNLEDLGSDFLNAPDRKLSSHLEIFSCVGLRSTFLIKK